MQNNTNLQEAKRFAVGLFSRVPARAARWRFPGALRWQRTSHSSASTATRHLGPASPWIPRTVVGITQASAAPTKVLEVCRAASGGLEGLLAGLRFVFDTTCVGLVLVIPTMQVGCSVLLPVPMVALSASLVRIGS